MPPRSCGRRRWTTQSAWCVASCVAAAAAACLLRPRDALRDYTTYVYGGRGVWAPDAYHGTSHRSDGRLCAQPTTVCTFVRACMHGEQLDGAPPPPVPEATLRSALPPTIALRAPTLPLLLLVLLQVALKPAWAKGWARLAAASLGLKVRGESSRGGGGCQRGPWCQRSGRDQPGRVRHAAPPPPPGPSPLSLPPVAVSSCCSQCEGVRSCVVLSLRPSPSPARLPVSHPTPHPPPALPARCRARTQLYPDAREAYERALKLEPTDQGLQKGFERVRAAAAAARRGRHGRRGSASFRGQSGGL